MRHCPERRRGSRYQTALYLKGLSTLRWRSACKAFKTFHNVNKKNAYIGRRMSLRSGNLQMNESLIGDLPYSSIDLYCYLGYISLISIKLIQYL